MIPDAPELQKKVTLSWYALISIIAVSVIVTGTAVKVLDNDTQREEQKKHFEKQLTDTKHFLLEEVSGLRSDWQRRYDDDLNKRLNKVEAYVHELQLED